MTGVPRLPHADKIIVIGLIALGLAVVLWYRIRQLSRQIDDLQRTVHRSSGDEPRAAAPAAEPEVRPQPGKQARAPAKRPLRRRVWVPARINWMVWLGGVSVALAGIFLVKYSIDQGLLTPLARVLLGVVGGLAMHGVVAWRVRAASGYQPALSALAAAGSITICAAILAALHLYDLIAPLPAFAVLAALAVATMVLALQHGPVLAVLGILGGYAVPLLVGGDSDRMGGVLAYATVVSVSGMLMVRYAYRRWLWWCMLAAALGWNLVSFGNASADGVRGLYLAALAACLIFPPALNWWPRLSWIGPIAPTWRSAGDDGSVPVASGKPPTWWGLGLVVVVQGLSIANEPFALNAALLWVVLPVTLYLACHRFPQYSALPPAVLALQGIAWLSTGFELDRSGISWQPSLVAWMPEMVRYAACSGLVHVVGPILLLRGGAPAAKWVPLTVLGPLSWLALAFFLATDHSSSALWSAASLAIGCIYAATGMVFQRRGDDLHYTWCVLGCSGAYSLAAAMFFSEAGLTVALAAQAVPLAWFAARSGAGNLLWATKGVLAATVLRLSLNPWLESYSSGTHWAVWAYGGSTLACFLASRVALPLPRLRRWTEAAGVQLLVLTLWAVPRSWIYDGAILAEEYSLAEASFNTVIWAALGMAYYWRSRASEHIAAVYLWASRVLMAMALANYAAVLLALNPLWSDETVSSTPVWNLLLLAYGAPVLLAALAGRFCEERSARWARRVAALAAFVFVTLEIRHLWQGALDIAARPGDGEMATYSITWTCMAFAAVLAGGMRYGAGVYRAGMALLVLAVAKVFLVDMSGLSGLLRAGSFLGLGLSLLGLALLHQKFRATLLPDSARE